MLFQKGHQINKGRDPWNKGKKGLRIGGRKKTGKEVICSYCNRSYYKKLSKLAKYGNFHPECFKKYLENHKVRPWSFDVEIKNSGEKNHNYKDIMVSESALHKWVTYHKGRPEFCFDCRITKEEAIKKAIILDWSNQSGLYFRDLDDFVGRCRLCHKKYDEKLGFPRKKCFDAKGRRIGITILIPIEYGRNWKELQNA